MGDRLPVPDDRGGEPVGANAPSQTRPAVLALSPALSASAADVMQVIAQWDMEDRGEPEQVLVGTISRCLGSVDVPCQLADREAGTGILSRSGMEDGVQKLWPILL